MPSKVISYTRTEAIVGSKPQDSFKIEHCTAGEAVELSILMVQKTVQFFQQISEKQIVEQAKLIGSIAQNVPGAKQFIEVYQQSAVQAAPPGIISQ